MAVNWDVERGVRRAEAIAKALKGLDEDWTLARLGRSSGLRAFIGRLLSDLDAAARYQDKHRVPLL